MMSAIPLIAFLWLGTFQQSSVAVSDGKVIVRLASGDEAVLIGVHPIAESYCTGVIERVLEPLLDGATVQLEAVNAPGVYVLKNGRSLNAVAVETGCARAGAQARTRSTELQSAASTAQAMQRGYYAPRGQTGEEQAAYAKAAATGPLTRVTPDVFAKLKALAADARAKNPTSPQSAAGEFAAAFTREFGDVTPRDSWITVSDELTAAVHTPLKRAHNVFVYSLNTLGDLPEEGPLDLLSEVAVVVSPSQMNAPNVLRVVLFSGITEIKPLQGSDFGPREFTNRLGAKAVLNAGTVIFPVSAFDTNEAVKILLITDRAPIEWTWSATTSRLK